METPDPWTEIINESNRALVINDLGPIYGGALWTKWVVLVRQWIVPTRQ